MQVTQGEGGGGERGLINYHAGEALYFLQV